MYRTGSGTTVILDGFAHQISRGADCAEVRPSTPFSKTQNA